ncbi:MAG: hypothetical protein BMS9Abin07_1591 [Acidimicrobiia bacterium]|nr:MAG: hypothetical protein BMS9Abin07_1591 [Acidimicrobiia bacterium]
MTAPAEPTHREPLSVGVLGAMGVAAVAYFVATFVVLHFVQPELDPVEHFVSRYAFGRFGWLVTLAFVVVGVGTLALALGLHRSLQPGFRVATSVVLMSIAGVGFVGSGIFKTNPLSPSGITAPTATGILHDLAGFVLFVALLIGAFILRGVFARDARWHGLERSALRFALGMLFAATVMFAVPRDVVGLVQRGLLAIMMTWLGVVGWWMSQLDPVDGAQYAATTSHVPAWSAVHDASSTRPFPRIARGDPWSGDRADTGAGERPWAFIGQRFVEGIPGLRISPP